MSFYRKREQTPAEALCSRSSETPTIKANGTHTLKIEVHRSPSVRPSDPVRTHSVRELVCTPRRTSLYERESLAESLDDSPRNWH